MTNQVEDTMVFSIIRTLSKTKQVEDLMST